MGDVVTAAHAARAALAAYEGGPAVAVVTLLDGPGAGRRLLLLETGGLQGTLGSEALDVRARELAREVLEGAEPRVVTVSTGAVEVESSQEPELEARDGVRLYVEAHRAPEELVIVGAGHIAVPISRLGVMLGYRVVVLDDRETMATPERFPGAAEVLRMDFDDPFRDVHIGPRSHVLLVTRAHRYDFDCLLQLLQGDASPGYIGMIGSRRRVRAAFHALLEAGVPREKLGTISAPVGLDIGAETPEEIAVAIAAELVGLRRARSRTGAGAGRDDSGIERDPTVEGDPGRHRNSALERESRPGQETELEVEALLAGRGEERRVGRVSDKERVLDRLLPQEDGDG